jgi:predicted sulfurtransferase
MIKKIGFVSVLGLLAFTVFVIGCQKGGTTALNNTAAANNTANVAAAPADAAARISLADAKTGFDAGTALFVDTRAEGAYNQEHIKGAINVSMDKLEAKLKELPKDKKIIAYCS